MAEGLFSQVANVSEILGNRPKLLVHVRHGLGDTDHVITELAVLRKVIKHFRPRFRPSPCSCKAM